MTDTAFSQGLLYLITSGALFGAMAIFYRIGKHTTDMENRFKALDEKMDRQFNLLDEKIDRQFNLLNEKLEEIKERVSRLEDRIFKLEERTANLEMRVAIMESRLSDVATNVTHLMWQHQSLPKAKEE